MGLLENVNRRVKKFSFMDVKLAQGAAAFFVLVIVKLIPQIMTLSIWLFVVLLVLFAVKPFCVFWFGK